MADDPIAIGVGSQEDLWVLDEDRRRLRLQLPALPIGDRSAPVNLFVEFDTGAVDQMLKRLLELRTQMLPPLESN